MRKILNTLRRSFYWERADRAGRKHIAILDLGLDSTYMGATVGKFISATGDHLFLDVGIPGLASLQLTGFINEDLTVPDEVDENHHARVIDFGVSANTYNAVVCLGPWTLSLPWRSLAGKRTDESIPVDKFTVAEIKIEGTCGHPDAVVQLTISLDRVNSRWANPLVPHRSEYRLYVQSTPYLQIGPVGELPVKSLSTQSWTVPYHPTRRYMTELALELFTYRLHLNRQVYAHDVVVQPQP